jgi:hypothetical protein
MNGGSQEGNVTTTYYSIIKYVPDAIREEHVNVGVIAVRSDGSGIAVRFDALQRAKSIGRRTDVVFLNEFQRSLKGLASEQATDQMALVTTTTPGEALTLEGRPRLDVDFIRKVADKWRNTIQFSEPRASLEPDPEQLADDVFRRYVGQGQRQKTRARDRRWIVSRAAESLESVVAKRVQSADASLIVRRNRNVEGAVETHTFELVLEPRELRHAAHAISLEAEDRDQVDREIEAAAWQLDDTRRGRPDLPLSLLVVEGASASRLERVAHLCRAFETRLVRSGEVTDWAGRTVQEALLP